MIDFQERKLDLESINRAQSKTSHPKSIEAQLNSKRDYKKKKVTSAILELSRSTNKIIPYSFEVIPINGQPLRIMGLTSYLMI